MSFLIAAALAGIAIPHHRPPHDVVRSRIAACGVADSRIRFVYDTDLQEDVAWIGRGPKLSYAEFNCLARVSLSNAYYLQFDDPRSEAAYRPPYQRAETVFAREFERKWLQDHGLLAKLPHFRPAKESVMAFAARLERYCGVVPGSMLTELRPNFLTLRREWVERTLSSGRSSERSFGCVMHGAGLSGLEEHGVQFGFIGNEAPSNAPKR
jgi:hypothetical protein